MAASSRLPGFLRRSVVANDSEDDEESISSSTSSLQEGDAAKDEPQSESIIAEERTNHQENDGVSPIIASLAGSSRASLPSSTTAPQPTVLDRQISEPRAVHASQAGTEGFPKTPEVKNEFQRSQTTPVSTTGRSSERKGSQGTAANESRPKSYRDTQFEKIFAANVVSMSDLKTLSWNGIPVSDRLLWKCAYSLAS